VKNGNGTQTLAGATTFNGTTTVNSGTLQAATANALANTSQVVLNNGGSLLVTADAAIGTNTSITMNGSTLVFGAAGYNGSVGALTLSADSILDLGTSNSGVLIRFHSINWSNANALLAIYNWTGTPQWQGGTGDNKDQVYFTNSTLSDTQLQRISFYSGLTTSSFMGTAFQLSGGSFNQQIIPVPEPETYAAAALLILGFAVHSMWLKRKAGRQHPAKPTA
jgi:autotransporter-associated beta strand protein